VEFLIEASLIVLLGVPALMVIALVAVNRSVVRLFEHVPLLNAVDRGPDSDCEVVSFVTSDGLTLSGGIIRPEAASIRGLILFCHEVSGNQSSARSYCEGLIEAGFAVVTFDFRNHGQSQQMPGYEPLHWLTDYELEDARAALRFIHSREELSSLPLGIFGVSRGGAAAISLAAESEEIRCVATDGAYTTNRMMRVFARRWATLLTPSWAHWMLAQWYVDTSLFLGRLRSEMTRHVHYVRLEKALRRLAGRPALLISGQRDSYVLPEITESLQATLGSETTDLWIVRGARHNQAREKATPEYDQRLVAFFRRNLGQTLEPVPLDCLRVVTEVRTPTELLVPQVEGNAP